MSVVERVRTIIEPVVAAFPDVEVYDIEQAGGVLRIVLDRPGGIDVDTIGDITPAISDALDSQDPFPGSKYLLEVTSPGIERKLRTPEHFASQVGADVTVKAVAGFEGPRRINGVLVAADGTSVTLRFRSEEKGAAQEFQTVQLGLDQIESARTVFHWGEQEVSPKASSSKKKVS